MSLLQAIVLGIVQGVAEFLPISSSGHLVIVPAVFGWEEPTLAFDVLLHVATLLALLWYFRRDFGRMAVSLVSREKGRSSDRRLVGLLALGTIATAVLYLAFDDVLDAILDPSGDPGRDATRLVVVGVLLCVTAAALLAAEHLSRLSRHDPAELRWWQAALIGLAQGAAIAPGISRSGATIVAGLLTGLDREQAARFSFLLSVPAVLGATLKTVLDALGGGVTLPPLGVSIAGFLTAAVTGYLAIAGLLAYLKNRSLHLFAAYAATVGIAVVIWQYTT